MKLVSAALVVTVQKHDFRPDLVLFPSVQVLSACETNEMFLETAPCFGAYALLFGADRDPTIFPHSFENGGSRKKAVPIRNTFDRLRSEDTRSQLVQFLVRNCYRSTGFWEIISAETHDFMTMVVVSCCGSGVLLTPPVPVK
jgi:hypothetical protein